MPVGFQFVKPDGDAQYLSKIDTELREALGLPADTHKYSQEYDLLTWIGIAAAKGREGQVTEEALADLIKDDPNCPIPLQVLRDFLIIKYKFIAWR